MAAKTTKSWKDKVAHHEGLIRLIEPGNTLSEVIRYLVNFSVLFVYLNCAKKKKTFLAQIYRNPALCNKLFLNFFCLLIDEKACLIPFVYKF